MTEHILVHLGVILVLGILAQWLAWHFHLPSILLLLLFGFVAGPVSGFLNPDALFGDLLLPLVSVSVAVILFEGGLSLKLRELQRIRSVVIAIVSVGALITWLVAAAAARVLLGLNLELAVLLGAILVVTGPTVIIPLLRHVRPTGDVGSILKWEGITIDPIGAMLAVLVFEALFAAEIGSATAVALLNVLRTVVVAGLIGAACAAALTFLLMRHWIPDFLQNGVSLTLVVASFVSANALQAEAGLLAVTLIGIVLANQRRVSVRHIVEFKENLRLLLISILFIILAARLQRSDLSYFDLRSLAFLGVLMFVARPLAVLVSSIGSSLNWKERLFLSWVAPRGIVAAAVSAIFAFRLSEAGFRQSEFLVPLTFMVIIGTVAVYGLSAAPLARLLSLARPNPQGVLLAGAHSWGRAVASALKEEGLEVLVADSNWANISTARMEHLPTYYGNILSEYAVDEMDLSGIGRFLAMTSNEEVNALAAVRFAEVFGRSEVYQLASEEEAFGGGEVLPQHLRGRVLFGQNMTFRHFSQRVAAGARIKKTRLTEEFDYEAYRTVHGESATPLFLVSEDKDLLIFAADNPPEPRLGQTIISLVDPEEEEKFEKTREGDSETAAEDAGAGR